MKRSLLLSLSLTAITLLVTMSLYSQKTYPTKMSFTFAGGNNMGAAIGNDCGNKDIDIQYNSIDGNMEVTVNKVCHQWSYLQHWMGNPYAPSLIFKNRYIELRVQSTAAHTNAVYDTSSSLPKGLFLRFQVTGGNPNGSYGKSIPCLPYTIKNANTWEIKFLKVGGNADTVFKEIDYNFDNGFYKFDYIYYGDAAVPPIPTIDQVKDKNVSDNAGVQSVTLTGIEIPGRLYDGLSISAAPKSSGILKDVAILDLGGGSGAYIDMENKSATLQYTPVTGKAGSSDSIIVTLRDTIRNTMKRMAFKVTLLAGPCSAPAPSASPITVCAGGTATLSASGGINYRWYDVSSGGVIIGSNPTFTTPVINSSTIFYVANYNGTCESSRTAVPVNIGNSISLKINTFEGILTGTSYPIQLTANIAGGIFTGDGVQNGYFVPALAKKNQLNMIYYTVNSGSCSGKDSIGVFVFPGAGKEDNFSAGICVFPNPGSGIFTLKATGIVNFSIIVYNEMGQLVYEESSLQSDKIIDFSSLPAGIYFLKASNDGKTMQTKFAIKK